MFASKNRSRFTNKKFIRKLSQYITFVVKNGSKAR